MHRICRHCKQPYPSRIGRGLCRDCWDNIEIRQQYPPVAAFGGKAASDIWKQSKENKK